MTNVNSISFQGNSYTPNSTKTEQHIWDNVEYMKQKNFPQEKIDKATQLACKASYLLGISQEIADENLGKKLDMVITNTDVLISRLARP